MSNSNTTNIDNKDYAVKGEYGDIGSNRSEKALEEPAANKDDEPCLQDKHDYFIAKLLEQAPASSSNLMSRTLQVLEHIMLNDSNSEVRKSALESYSDMVKMEQGVFFSQEVSASNPTVQEAHPQGAHAGSNLNSMYRTGNTPPAVRPVGPVGYPSFYGGPNNI